VLRQIYATLGCQEAKEPATQRDAMTTNAQKTGPQVSSWFRKIVAGGCLPLNCLTISGLLFCLPILPPITANAIEMKAGRQGRLLLRTSMTGKSTTYLREC